MAPPCFPFSPFVKAGQDCIFYFLFGRNVQLERLMARDGCTRAEATAKISSQMPLERKVQLADHVLQNSGSLGALQQQVRPGLFPGRGLCSRLQCLLLLLLPLLLLLLLLLLYCCCSYCRCWCAECCSAWQRAWSDQLAHLLSDQDQGREAGQEALFPILSQQLHQSIH
jgi:hypothetical protein